MSQPSQQKTRRQRLEEFVAAKPNDPFSRYGLAVECMNLGDATGAEEHFRKLIATNPDYVPAYQQLGQLLVRLGRYGEARDVLSSGMVVAQKKGDQHARSEMEALLVELK